MGNAAICHHGAVATTRIRGAECMLRQKRHFRPIRSTYSVNFTLLGGIRDPKTPLGVLMTTERVSRIVPSISLRRWLASTEHSKGKGRSSGTRNWNHKSPSSSKISFLTLFSICSLGPSAFTDPNEVVKHDVVHTLRPPHTSPDYPHHLRVSFCSRWG